MIALLLTRWKLIVPIILISAMSLSILYYKTRYTRSVHELDALVQGYERLKDAKEAENKALREVAQIHIKNLMDEHDKQVAHFNLDRKKSESTLKAQYENSEFILNRTKHNYDERLRIESSRTSTLPESTSDSSKPASTESDCNSAYSTLEDACRITTIDYNALRGWADTVCLTVGCE